MFNSWPGWLQGLETFVWPCQLAQWFPQRMLSGNLMVYKIILNSCSLEATGQDLVHYGLRKILRVGSGLLNSYTGEPLCWWKGAGPGLAATSAPSITDTSMRAFLSCLLHIEAWPRPSGPSAREQHESGRPPASATSRRQRELKSRQWNNFWLLSSHKSFHKIYFAYY